MINNFKLPVKHNVDLKDLSTFGISSISESVVNVSSLDNLLYSLTFCYENKIPYRVISGGSNIVFPDNGVKDLIIAISGGMIKKEGDLLIIESGVNLLGAVNYSINLGLSGLEYLSGIPGSVGGAVYGNAGAYGHSIADSIEWVSSFSEGSVKKIKKKDSHFSYRNSIFKENKETILEVGIRLIRGNKESLRQESERIIKERELKYHPHTKCPGSFFKNIPLSSLTDSQKDKIDLSKVKGGKVPAGYLLEEVDANGMKVGDIEVASYHGNLLINKGYGTEKDVKRLAGILKAKVYDKFGINLEEEVIYF